VAQRSELVVGLDGIHMREIAGAIELGLSEYPGISSGRLEPTDHGIAWVGLGADLPEDTIYPTAFNDGDGNPLDSANKYVMHYEKGTFQPANGSWSISQYKGNLYEVNALNRYVIAPWMPLKFNKDGSLDILLQADSPSKGKEPNWLPTPPGVFNITIRNYGDWDNRPPPGFSGSDYGTSSGFS
jgi:Protein of unknown function (DUF1214)